MSGWREEEEKEEKEEEEEEEEQEHRIGLDVVRGKVVWLGVGRG